MTMMNPNPFADAETGRRLSLAFDRYGGRGAALRAAGLADKDIFDPWRTARVLHEKYRTPKNLMRRLGMDTSLLDAPDARPALALDSALVDEHEVNTPEDALKALQRTSPEVLQDGGIDPETDPRVSFVRNQLSEGDFKVFTRVLRDVQRQWERSSNRPAHDRRLAHDGGFLRQELSPAEYRAHMKFLRDLARIGPKARLALDHASAERSFQKMFPDASLPEINHY